MRLWLTGIRFNLNCTTQRLEFLREVELGQFDKQTNTAGATQCDDRQRLPFSGLYDDAELGSQYRKVHNRLAKQFSHGR